MIVYSLFLNSYEGYKPNGVYSTKEKAVAIAKEELSKLIPGMHETIAILDNEVPWSRALADRARSALSQGIIIKEHEDRTSVNFYNSSFDILKVEVCV